MLIRNKFLVLKGLGVLKSAINLLVVLVSGQCDSFLHLHMVEEAR